MNGLERAWAEELAKRKAVGEILWFRYEGIALRLADGARYTPDFALMFADGTLELHEVKAFWAEAARLRIKVAAELFPFRFLAVRRGPKNAGWQLEEF